MPRTAPRSSQAAWLSVPTSPNRSPSSMHMGLVPADMMSRMMPPTPVAAPPYGSTADGWLWLSMWAVTT